MAGSEKTKASDGGTVLFNQTSTPCVISAQGHILGGGERRAVERVDEVAQLAIDGGYLIVEEAEASDPEPEPQADKRAQAKASGESGPTKGA